MGPNLKKDDFSPASVRALKAMRSSMTDDAELRERLSTAGESEIRGVLEDRFWGTNSDDVITSAAATIAAEVMKMRSDPGTYLVDEQTGRSMFKMTPDMIYQPPVSYDEDGNERTQLPMLHPGITSGLALLSQEKIREERIKKSVPSGMEESVAHLLDPWRIVDQAMDRIVASGIEFYGTARASSDERALPLEATVVVGRESAVGSDQSFSFKFHRSVMYGASLAVKVAELGAKRVCFTGVERRRDAKHVWYEVKLIYGS